MAREVMTRLQVVEAHKLLTAHGTKRDGGWYDYHENWDDASVAAVMGGGVKPQAIARLRLDMFGKVEPSPFERGKAATEETTALRTEIAALRAELETAKQRGANLRNGLQEEAGKQNRAIADLTAEVRGLAVTLANLNVADIRRDVASMSSFLNMTRDVVNEHDKRLNAVPLAELLDKYNRLCDNLSVNRVQDVRHLRVGPPAPSPVKAVK